MRKRSPEADKLVKPAVAMCLFAIFMRQYPPPRHITAARRIVSGVIGKPGAVGRAWHTSVVEDLMRFDREVRRDMQREKKRPAPRRS